MAIAYPLISKAACFAMDHLPNLFSTRDIDIFAQRPKSVYMGYFLISLRMVSLDILIPAFFGFDFPLGQPGPPAGFQPFFISTLGL